MKQSASDTKADDTPDKAQTSSDNDKKKITKGTLEMSSTDSDPVSEPEARLAEIVAELAKTHAEYEDKLQVK